MTEGLVAPSSPHELSFSSSVKPAKAPDQGQIHSQCCALPKMKGKISHAVGWVPRDVLSPYAS